MSNSESFERLLQKALQTQDLPPLPSNIVGVWLRPQADAAAKWVWLLPAVVFFLGLGLGAVLAPSGLGNAYAALQSTLSDIWHAVPETALTWALALLVGVSAIAADSARRVSGRPKQAKNA